MVGSGSPGEIIILLVLNFETYNLAFLLHRTASFSKTPEMAGTDALLPNYINPVVTFSAGSSYKAISNLASYRICHDGSPAEARVVLSCHEQRQGLSSETHDETLILKIKVQ